MHLENLNVDIFWTPLLEGAQGKYREKYVPRISAFSCCQLGKCVFWPSLCGGSVCCHRPGGSSIASNASVINLLLQPPEAPHHSCCCCSSKCWWTAYLPIFLLISVFKRLSVKFTAMLSPNFCKPLESYTCLFVVCRTCPCGYCSSFQFYIFSHTVGFEEYMPF